MAHFPVATRPRLTALMPWPLVTAGAAWLRFGASLGLLSGVLLSRLLLLPDGPWEQDEALIACGVVDFDPAHHMPLPPGFPLWVLIGRLVRLLGVADPLVALQVASAALSVVALWASVGLLDRWVGRTVAVSGALLAAFMPGVWVHASRAFSGTAAAAFALLALAAWANLGERGFVPGVGLMTAAALIRPPLAPWFVLAVVLASWGVRRSPRRLVAGALVAVALAVVVLVPLVFEAGGWELFWGAGVTHAAEHFGLVGTEDGGFAGLGFTVGVGGSAAAAAVAVLAALGWTALYRRLRWQWWAGTIAAAMLVFVLVVLHNRTYPRYWVLVWLVAAPLAVHGVATLVRLRWLAASVAVAATVAASVTAWPAVAWMHRHALPAVDAMRTAASEGRGVLVFDDGLFSFRNLAARQGWLRIASMRTSEIPARRMAVGGDTFWFLTDGPGIDAPASVATVFDGSCREPGVVALSQHRFLTSRLVRNPVLVWRGGSVPEQEETRRFTWCSSDCLLLLPPLTGAGFVTLGVEVHHLLGEVPIRATVSGVQTLEVSLAGRGLVRVPIPPLPERNALRQVVPVRLEVGSEIELPGDRRPLAFRIFACSVEAPPYAPRPFSVVLESDALLAEAATAAGVYVPELIGEPRRAATWVGPEGIIDMPMGPGMVVLEMLAPRPGPVPTKVLLGDASAFLLVPQGMVRVALPVPPELARQRRGVVRILSEPFVPGPGDLRRLGVAVSRIAYVPDLTSTSE